MKAFGFVKSRHAPYRWAILVAERDDGVLVARKTYNTREGSFYSALDWYREYRAGKIIEIGDPIPREITTEEEFVAFLAEEQ